MGVILACGRIPIDQPGIYSSQQSGCESCPAWGNNDSSTALGLLVEHGCVLESYGQVLLSGFTRHTWDVGKRTIFLIIPTGARFFFHQPACLMDTLITFVLDERWTETCFFSPPDDAMVRLSWDGWLFQRWTTGCKLTVGVFFEGAGGCSTPRWRIHRGNPMGRFERESFVFHRPTGPPAHGHEHVIVDFGIYTTWKVDGATPTRWPSNGWW